MSEDEHRDAPIFVLEDRVEIEATAGEIWAVLLDFDAYVEWNPYVLAIAGEARAGAPLEITIAQANWPEPLVVKPELVAVEADRLLHWRSRLGDPIVFETDHSFVIEPVTPGRCQFLQREEFRGPIAAQLDVEARHFTQTAFRAMDEALVRRVAKPRG